MATTEAGAPKVANRTGREFEQDLAAHDVLTGNTIEFVRGLSSRHSELFEYRVRSGIKTRLIIAKRQAPGPDAERRTLQEFTNLEKVRAALGDACRQRVPQAVLVLPKKGLLVTEKVPGISFSVILKRNANCIVGPFRGSLIRKTGQSIGKWLSDFQNATRTESVAFEADRFLAHLERHVSRCRAWGLGTDSALAILQHASAQAARLNGKLVPTAGRHGDFIPQNVLVFEHNHVAVVDFEGFRERQPIYDDVGMFLAYLAVLTTRFRYLRSSLNAGAKGFLNGVTMRNSLDQDFTNVYILKGIVRILADGSLRKGIWNRWIISRMLARLHQSNLPVL